MNYKYYLKAGLLQADWRMCVTDCSAQVRLRSRFQVNSTVQYSTVQYSTVQYSTVQYSTEQYSKVQYNTVQLSKVQYSTVQYSTVQYSTVQYSTVRYSTVQYIKVQYSTKVQADCRMHLRFNCTYCQAMIQTT